MAHVAVPTNVSAWIDDYLDYLFDVMNDLPKIAAEWDSWDDLEQLDFVVEWDIKRDRLLQLKNWDSQGLFAAAQQDRYGELLDLLERQQPILDKLLAERALSGNCLLGIHPLGSVRKSPRAPPA